MKVGFFFCSIQGGVLINKWWPPGRKKQQLPMDKPKFFEEKKIPLSLLARYLDRSEHLSLQGDKNWDRNSDSRI